MLLQQPFPPFFTLKVFWFVEKIKLNHINGDATGRGDFFNFKSYLFLH